MKCVVVLIFLSVSVCSNAQKLSLPELMSLRTLSAEKADAFLKGKGFTVARNSKEGDATITMYRSQVIENGKIVSRIVNVSRHDTDISLHYGLFDKKEADSLISWLESDGFAFKGKKLLVAKQIQSTYTKDQKTIFFIEVAYEGSPVLYQFAIHSPQHFQ